MDSALSIVSLDHDHYMSVITAANPFPKPTSMGNLTYIGQNIGLGEG